MSRYAPLCRNCHRRPARAQVGYRRWKVVKGHDLCRQCYASLCASFRAYVLRLGFLDGVPGLVHVSIGCMNSFNKYAKLIALQRGAS